MKKINLNTEKIYQKLRLAHSLIKDIYGAANYKKLCKKHKNLDFDIENIEVWLYETEKEVSEF